MINFRDSLGEPTTDNQDLTWWEDSKTDSYIKSKKLDDMSAHFVLEKCTGMLQRVLCKGDRIVLVTQSLEALGARIDMEVVAKRFD
jgi:hypothetical protein